jgi:hypothetical protein
MYERLISVGIISAFFCVIRNGRSVIQQARRFFGDQMAIAAKQTIGLDASRGMKCFDDARDRTVAPGSPAKCELRCRTHRDCSSLFMREVRVSCGANWQRTLMTAVTGFTDIGEPAYKKP